jgi:hypothetical protein
LNTNNTQDVNGLKDLTTEVKDIFNDSDINLSRVLRELATCFGADATLHKVATSLDDFKLPTREVDGQIYIAGYKGSEIIEAGPRIATLIDIKQSGQSAKLMFSVGCKYIFYTLETFRVEDIVNYTKKIGKTFDIIVAHEIIENTGHKHATVLTVSER